MKRKFNSEAKNGQDGGVSDRMPDRKSQNGETMTVEELRAMWSSGSPNGNRKVRNATRIERDGVVFASKIERFMYDLLTLHGIGFEFQKRYVLQEGFRYNGETVRPITYTTDFWLPDHDMVIDTKGHKTQQGTLRIKLLKRQFAEAGMTTRIELPRNPDECSALVGRLIDEKR